MTGGAQFFNAWISLDVYSDREGQFGGQNFFRTPEFPGKRKC